jgi:hypothetical protein
MGARYSANRTSAALSTTNDTMTIIAPATRALKIWEVRLYGQGTTSAANEVAIARSSAGVTGGGAIVPTPLATLSAASGVTVNTTWTTQPTLGVVLRRVGVNANGAYSPLVFMPGSEIDVPPSGQISLRSITGTSNVTAEVVFEEVG